MNIRFDSQNVLATIETSVGAISILNGEMCIGNGEAREIEVVLQKVWRYLCAEMGVYDFSGLIRFDLAPKLTHLSYGGGEVRCQVGVGGIYEINGHSPECAAVYVFMHEQRPDLFPNLNILNPLVEAIRRYNRSVVLLNGHNPVKEMVAPAYRNFLISQDLTILSMEKCPNPDEQTLILRFGDYWEDGKTQFTQEEVEYMRRAVSSGAMVFNALGKDALFRKDILFHLWRNTGLGYLLGKLPPRALSFLQEDVEWAQKHKDSLILKPDRGCSGNGIYFGYLCSQAEWTQVLQREKGKGYSFWNMQCLPSMKFGEHVYAMDLNVACLAQGSALTPLYIVSRIKPRRLYLETGTMNVAQGSGIIPFASLQ